MKNKVIEGKLQKAAGAVQYEAGKIMGDGSTQAKGASRYAEGTVVEKAGKVQNKAKEILEDSQDR